MKTNNVETLNGRVIHDGRGNARWDWAVSTAVLAKKTVADLISTLDVPALAIAGDPAGAVAGDPYNSCGRHA